ncbi:MAG: hypothetical protein J5965_11180 [Aeriscardovia sp.]|nr:hypothetical protein [Aeriscardovia sp.]
MTTIDSSFAGFMLIFALVMIGAMIAITIGMLNDDEQCHKDKILSILNDE